MDLLVIEIKWILFHDAAFNTAIYVCQQEAELCTVKRRSVIIIHDAHSQNFVEQYSMLTVIDFLTSCSSEIGHNLFIQNLIDSHNILSFLTGRCIPSADSAT